MRTIEEIRAQFLGTVGPSMRESDELTVTELPIDYPNKQDMPGCQVLIRRGDKEIAAAVPYAQDKCVADMVANQFANLLRRAP